MKEFNRITKAIHMGEKISRTSLAEVFKETEESETFFQFLTHCAFIACSQKFFNELVAESDLINERIADLAAALTIHVLNDDSANVLTILKEMVEEIKDA